MPAPDRPAIVDALFRVIDAINGQLPKGKKLEKALDVPLLGPGAALDSLMLMNLVVETEARIAEDFGLEVALADLLGLPLEENPLRTLGALADDLTARAAAAA